MISKRIKGRKDGKSSASSSLRYGEGLTVDRETGEVLDKSHRTRLGNFGAIDDGVYIDAGIEAMERIIKLAAIEMQANCDQNTRVGADKRIAHFVVSYNQEKPSEAVLRDTEDSMLAEMGLDKNHFATFLHNDNGYWHMHIFASCIEKDKPHRGNPLWQDRTKRDKVCREIEARHGLQADNGMHQVNELGQIVEIPRSERRAKREQKPVGISDRAKTTETYSGEKSFQTWANEIRLGDRLKHAKSWADLHAAAAAYGCEVKEKGAGFIVCPVGQKGGLSLSKIGLTKLPAKFGAFQQDEGIHQEQPQQAYMPGPTTEKADSHYQQWAKAKGEFKPLRIEKLNKQREGHAQTRKAVRSMQQTEMQRIRVTPNQNTVAAVSLAKMRHTIELAALAEQFADERKALRQELANAGPGNTFRDYLQRTAERGDNEALGLVRRYGEQEATEVLRLREANQLKIVAVIKGKQYRPAQRLNFAHQVQRNGTVVYYFGQGRTVTDSALSRQVQLNDAAAHSPEAVATALAFAATKFGNTLTLSGPAEFQRLAVETAALKHPGIRFADPALEAYRAQIAATRRPGYGPEFNHLSHTQIQQGIQNVLDRTPGKPPAHIIARNKRIADDLVRAKQHRPEHETHRGSGVHDLPAGGLDGQGQDAGMLLPDPVHDGLGNPHAWENHDVRHAGASARSSGSDRTDTSTTTDAAEPSIQRRNTVVRTAGDRDQKARNPKRNGVPVTPLTVRNQQPGEAVPLAPSSHAEQLPAQTASQWLAEQPKRVGEAYAKGDGKTEYVVVHVAHDGIVIDHGTELAKYAVPKAVNLQPGDRVVLGKKGAIAQADTPTKGGKDRGR